MALKRLLTEQELSLLEIFEDPVYLGEFLRNTADGSPRPEEWTRKQEFKYRWYQKDLLTDQNSNIVIRGGRAIGKCHPAESRVYTVEWGYVPCGDLLTFSNTFKSFSVYAFDENMKLTRRRAIITEDARQSSIQIRTKQGHELRVTSEHPVYTDRGFIPAYQLSIGNRVAVMHTLPKEGTNHFTWAELRYLGYLIGREKITAESVLCSKYQAQFNEVRAIAEEFYCNVNQTHYGVSLKSRTPTVTHYGSKLLKHLGIVRATQSTGIYRIPIDIKRERLENIKIFLEALFSEHAEITGSYIKMVGRKNYILDLQELLLGFGIESRADQVGRYRDNTHRYGLTIDTYNDYYTFFDTFTLPGIKVPDMPKPKPKQVHDQYYKFDEIVDIQFKPATNTYSIEVLGDPVYIANNVIVHNTVTLEDKIIFLMVNGLYEFPETNEMLLTTPNTAQMTPLLDGIIRRFNNSDLLKSFINKGVNRSKGTIDFTGGSRPVRMYARIAGSKGDSNVIGLHIPRIIGDEFQIYPWISWVQLQPTLNVWESKVQQMYAGVPSGMQDGNVLFFLDQKSQKFKKYRIPATENPYFTYGDYVEAIKSFGGEDSDDFIHLVLGHHGEAAFSVIPRDKMRFESFEIISSRYHSNDKLKGIRYQDALKLYDIPDKYKAKALVMAIDTGYTDPTLIQLIGLGADDVWRTLARYRLTRIGFPEQAEIIDWLDNHYRVGDIAIDLGAGGGGIGIMQDLTSPRFNNTKYSQKILGVRFSDYIEFVDPISNDLVKVQAKVHGSQELTKMVTEGEIRFSEIDGEGVSQLERLAYTRRSDGTPQYFILSENGKGKSGDDHIYASYVVFTIFLALKMAKAPRKKLNTNVFWG